MMVLFFLLSLLSLVSATCNAIGERICVSTTEYLTCEPTRTGPPDFGPRQSCQSGLVCQQINNNTIFCVMATPTPTPITVVANLTLSQILNIQTREISRINLLKEQDFVFDFYNPSSGVTTGPGGNITTINPDNFPAVVGHGIVMTIGRIAACGINLPHIHPRATEINFVSKGEFQAGFFAENGAHFLGNTLRAPRTLR
eukprot:TRINITY_DN8575_c0_g1_i2.p1 TRINITY_DN8575_c0_g1~~TRINITY_DN8575_c0_g1_i2.p1  ORF type:complete len:199 (+),score=25.36 TRINITY_DN8575_c0_g1_i2:346-942(+)